MIWTLNEPKKGDIVRVKIGNFYHYGIYVNDDEIIQFGLPPVNLRRDSSKVQVCATSLDVFLCGNFLEVGEAEKKEKKKMAKPDKIVENARKRIGEGNYHILYNNCEHFVNQCAFGEKVCLQVEEVRQVWKKFPFVNVFVKKYPFELSSQEIYPFKRQEEIDKCKNIDVKQEKIYDWKLLEYAIKQSLGIDIKDVNFFKKNTKWLCDNFEFSLSHTQNIVAVVVARNKVGIDIEKQDFERFNKFPIDKILTKQEIKQNILEKHNLNEIWTIKEAVFKKNDKKSFIPNKEEILKEKYQTKLLDIDGEKFYLTVATEDKSFIKFNLGEGITIVE